MEQDVHAGGWKALVEEKGHKFTVPKLSILSLLEKGIERLTILVSMNRKGQIKLWFLDEQRFTE